VGRASDGEALLRSVAIRRRQEHSSRASALSRNPIHEKEALGLGQPTLAHSLAMLRATLESTTDPEFW
jgi:hypothetical protein